MPSARVATEATERQGEGMTMRQLPAADLEANKEVARRVSQEIWSGGNVELIDRLVTPDYVRHGSDAELAGREALRQTILGLRAGVPDWTETIEAILAEGDLVAYRYTGRGTYRGQLPGLPPPNGQPFVLKGLVLHQIVDGQVVETWSVFDQVSLLVQLGAMPAPPAAPPAS
jgi:predicted ester cyclase